ncbi:MAG TPA: cadherin-like domain-containing protein [Acidimicrobiales bacterium]
MIRVVRIQHRSARCGHALFSGLAMVASTLALIVLAGPAHAATPGVYAYAANNDGTVSVIDTNTNSVYDSMSLGLNHRSQEVAISGDGRTVYVMNYNEMPGTVSVIDATTDTKVAEYDAGASPVDMALTPDGTTLYVANRYTYTGSSFGPPAVLVIDTATGAVNGTIPIDNGPQHVTASPDGTAIYVVTFGGGGFADGKLFDISTATNMVQRTLTGIYQPRDVAFAPDGATAYVTGSGANNVFIVDTGSFAITGSISTGDDPQRVAVTANGAELYVVINPGSYGSVAIYDIATHALITTTSVGDSPTSVAFTPDGTAAYVMNSNNNLNTDPPVPSTVSVIDTGTHAVTNTITVGFAGADLAVSPVALSTAPIRGPIPANDAYTAFIGQPLTVTAPGVLGNDTDPAGTTLVAGSPSRPNQNGSVTLNADGSFTYTPDPYYVGIETFTYEVSDARGAMSRAMVTINVIQAVGPPTSSKQCLKNGWKTFNNPVFKSQTACLRYVSKHRTA